MDTQVEDVLDDALLADAEATRDRLIAQAQVASPLDASLRRGNNRPDVALPPSLFDAKPLTQPSITLDPGNITGLDGYAALEGYGCQPAVEALTALHTTVQRIITARDAYMQDATLTQTAQVLAVDDLHAQLMPVATRKMDAALRTLDAAIAASEAQLSQAIKDTGNALSQEVRSHVRSLKPAERMTVLAQAINSGDAVTVGALLGCSVPMLTGLDLSPEAHAALVTQWHTKRSPDAARKLALMKAAKGKLEAAGSVAIGSIDGIVGSKSRTRERLRTNKAKLKTIIGINAGA